MSRLVKLSGVLLLLVSARIGVSQIQSSVDGNRQPDHIGETEPREIRILPPHPELSNENSGFLTPGTDPQNKLLFPLIRHLASDQKQFWTSPRARAKGEVKAVLPFAAFTGMLFASDRWISEQVPDRPHQMNLSRNLSDYGVYSLIGAAGGAFLWGHATNNDHLSETGLLSGEAALNSTAVTYLLKGVTQRRRPLAGNGTADFFARNSFPSEHSAIAWSVASVVAHEYPGPLTKLLAYGLASTVTLARVTSKQHFASDAVVGSALGWYFGRQVYRAHHDPGLGGGAWGNLWEEKFETPRNPASMGSPYVPLDSWVYPAFERLATEGYFATDFLGLRPWTRIACARLLEEASDRITQDESHSNDAARAYHALEDEFSWERERLEGNRNLGFRLETVYTRATGISGPPLTDGYNFARTMFNDYGRPFQEGMNTYSGMSGYGTAGPFAFYIRGEHQHAASAPGFSDSVRTAVAAQEGVPVLPYTPFPELNRFRLIEGYVTFALRGVQFSFGKQSLWWGPTETGSLVWSTNAESIPMLRMSSVVPFQLPIFLKWLGPMRTEFFLGQLDGHRFIMNAQGVAALGPSSTQPFVHGTKLSFKPTPNLEFGFSRTVVLGGAGHPFTFRSFWKSATSLGDSATFDPGHDAGDRRSGFDVSYRLPHLRDRVMLYSDSFCDDDVSPLAAPQRCAWSPGVYMPQLPYLPHFDFRAEGVWTDVWGFQSTGVNYQNVIYRSGYTNDGNILGSWVGRQGRGVQLWSTYWLSPRNKIQAGYRYQGVDPDYLKGGRSDDVSLRADVMLRSDLTFSGTAQYERWNFPLLATNAKSNVAVSVGFTYRPRWNWTQK